MVDMSNEVRKITLSLVLSWILGILFALIGLASLVTGDFIIGLCLILASLVLLPPVNNLLRQRFNFELSRWLKIVIVLVLLVIGGANVPSETTDISKPTASDSKVIITKTVNEMLPVRADIPTEFKTGSVKNITINTDGFESGSKVSFTKLQGSHGGIFVDFVVYKFLSIDSDSSYYESLVPDITEEGGYKELSLPYAIRAECFGYTQDFGFELKMGESICKKDNVIFKTLVSGANTFSSIDGYIKDMTRIVDEKV